jgi:ATP-binding cassette subfamily F protein 3
LLLPSLPNVLQVIGDDTTAIDSVLKADVWRDHLLKEQATLDAKLTELDSAGDEKRFEDEREEFSSRLAEVHSRLTEMDAESGPSRAAALLAGKTSLYISATYLNCVLRPRFRRS